MVRHTLKIPLQMLQDFFFQSGFSSQALRFTWQQGKGGDHLLFHSTTSTRSQTLRHLFATLHVRWLSCIFNCNACVYQTAVYELPPCLFFTWWIDTRFLLERFDIGNRRIWNRIDYQPCITSEPTNQVC